jgi:hypothetical protein
MLFIKFIKLKFTIITKIIRITKNLYTLYSYTQIVRRNIHFILKIKNYNTKLSFFNLYNIIEIN